MSETWCGSLLVVLVPLVTGLNAALLYQIKGLQAQVGHRRSGEHDVGPGQ